MRFSRMTTAAAAVAILACGVTFWTASAQPAGGDGKPGGPPPAGEGRGRPNRGGGGDGPGAGERGPRSEWVEKYKDELRDHPRMARSLVALHEAKDYMEKAPGDFGGHKAAASNSITNVFAGYSVSSMGLHCVFQKLLRPNPAIFPHDVASGGCTSLAKAAPRGMCQ